DAAGRLSPRHRRCGADPSRKGRPAERAASRGSRDRLGRSHGDGAVHGRGASSGASDRRAPGHHAGARAVARAHAALDSPLRDPAQRLQDLSRSLARAGLGAGDRRDVFRARRGHRAALRRARADGHAGALRAPHRRPDRLRGEEPLHHAAADVRRPRAGDPYLPRRRVPRAEGRGLPMNGGRLQGRVALVPGASRNIGRAVALAFAAEGADLVLNTRVNAAELDAVAAECRKAGVRTVTALGDVGDPAVCQAMVERGLAELGAVDVLVCNAAIRPHKSVTDTSVEEWHRVLGVNLHSAFYLAGAAVPAMKERRRGSIIALGGMSSLTGRPNTAVVTVAKTGLLGLVRPLAAELGPFGIRVNMVMPGFIDTERRHAEWYPEFRQSPPGSPEELAKIPLRRLGRPEDIADACVFLASDASSYVTGDSIRVMGGRVIGGSVGPAAAAPAPAPRSRRSAVPAASDSSRRAGPPAPDVARCSARRTPAALR